MLQAISTKNWCAIIIMYACLCYIQRLKKIRRLQIIINHIILIRYELLVQQTIGLLIESKILCLYAYVMFNFGEKFFFINKVVNDG